MTLRNNTRIDTQLLRELARFCMPAGVTNAIIQVSYASRDFGGYYGRAYGHRYRLMSQAINFEHQGYPTPDIKIYVERKPRGTGKIEHRQKGVKGKGYLPSVEYTQPEAILHLLAHELRHLYQAIRQKRATGRVWGARGVYSERDCDAYAIRMVRHYRRAGSPFYGPKGEVPVHVPKHLRCRLEDM